MTIIPQPTPVWLSEAQVRDLVVSARRAKASLLAVIAGIDERVAKRRDQINNSLADLSMKDRVAAVDASASTLRASLKAETNKQRTELLRSISRMNEQAKAAIQFYDNPVAMLLRDTIASTKRVAIFQNLEAAGPVELKGFASLAIATGDRDMASAVVARLHAISPASARPTSPKSVADALVGELQRELMGALLEVDSLLTEAVLADRLFEQGRSGSTGIGSVELALKRRRDAAVGGTRVEDEADGQ
jgi:hypothetical protein